MRPPILRSSTESSNTKPYTPRSEPDHSCLAIVIVICSFRFGFRPLGFLTQFWQLPIEEIFSQCQSTWNEIPSQHKVNEGQSPGFAISSRLRNQVSKTCHEAHGKTRLARYRTRTVDAASHAPTLCTRVPKVKYKQSKYF